MNTQHNRPSEIPLERPENVPLDAVPWDRLYRLAKLLGAKPRTRAEAVAVIFNYLADGVEPGEQPPAGLTCRAELVMFPMAARVKFIASTARFASESDDPDGFIERTIREQERHLRRRGLDEGTIQPELASLEHEIRCRMQAGASP